MTGFDHDLHLRLARSTRLGRRVVHADETTSTMDDARRGADENPEVSVGTAYVGGRQTAGRGRLGRSWISEPGAGLYVTYHLAPGVDAANVPLFAAAGALAVADAVREIAGLGADIKWPNDVLVDGRKLAGVLAEARHGARLDVFLGIGVNLRASALPHEVRTIATSIEDAAGEIPSLEAVLAAISAALEDWCVLLEAAPSSFVAAWRNRLATLGRQLRLALPDGTTVEGEAVDVSLTGELVLQHLDGSRRPYTAGDVTTI